MPTAIAAGVVPGTATSTGCRIYVILQKNKVEQISRNSQPCVSLQRPTALQRYGPPTALPLVQTTAPAILQAYYTRLFGLRKAYDPTGLRPYGPRHSA